MKQYLVGIGIGITITAAGWYYCNPNKSALRYTQTSLSAKQGTPNFAKASTSRQGEREENNPTTNIDTTQAKPQTIDELITEGNKLINSGKVEQARNIYLQVLEIEPNHIGALFNLGVAARKRCLWEKMDECFSKVLELSPNHMHSLRYKAFALQKMGLHTKAISFFEQALALRPQDPGTLDMIARAYFELHTQDGYQKALQHLATLITLKPDTLEIQLQRAHVLLWFGQTEKATKLYEQLLQKYPNNTQLYISTGYEFEQNHLIDTAIEYYKRAIEVDPNNSQAHIALSGALFNTKQYKQGFIEYEWRFNAPGSNPLPNRWDGTDPAGKKVVLLAENGLGDIIQFIRFAKLVKEQGAYVITTAPKPLVQLFKLCPYIDEVSAVGTPVPQHHFRTSLQCLPYIYELEEDLHNEPYLFANKKLVKYWKQKLNTNTKTFNVGICWKAGGGKADPPHRKRNIPLNTFAPLAHIPGVKLFGIQKKDRVEDPDDIPNFSITLFDEQFDVAHGGFMDSAAVMQNMNVVISVDTSTGHLAGALGVPTIIVLPYAADPRWTISGTTTPWYKTVQLVRQSQPGNWETAIKQVVNKIIAHKERKNL